MFLASCLLPFTSFSQINPPVPEFPFDGSQYYRSAQNPYYWKNRKPHEAYWQQDVHYRIVATLNDTTGIVDGSEELTYWNNSPDTLSFVYFHLYQNAFVKGSYLESLNKANDFHQRFGPYEAAGKGTEILDLKASERDDAPATMGGPQLQRTTDLKYEIDNTIMKVWLHKPIAPGEGYTFKIHFKTYFDNGDQRRRMKKFIATGSRSVHYDGVHWYPRICVYDAKFGWDTYQHLGKEFYGDFGAYDVKLRFPNHYVLDGTGQLLNRDEVLPPALRQKLDIRNFKDKPVGSAASVITEPNGTYKTWIFHADNVHDFAWTADPTYRIGEAEWNGVQCIALAQESNAAGWQDAAAFTARVIQTYSRDFGMYAYPKMIVADARDGMEYPMLTLDGGLFPGYHFVIAHEIGHNWFFGMVGNNETYRAALDEGFTQFLTSWSLKDIDGIWKPDGIYSFSSMYYKEHKSWYNRKFDQDLPIDETTVYLGYLRDAINRSDAQLNTHSDDFGSALNHGGGYGHVYYKTATMLYNLQYVLGDSLFRAAMSHYFNQWKICHPYFDDFRNSIIRFTHVDLNWFFDQWMETTKRIDYAVCRVKKEASGQAITFRRKGEMQMPLDFALVNDKKDTFLFTIPNTYFAKSQPGYMAVDRWFGWGRLNECYTTHVNVPGKIKNVIIDPSNRLADVNMLDNSKKCPVDWRFDSKVSEPQDRRKYVLRWRPDLWYNRVDGVKAGLHFNGGYMNYHHVFSSTVWYNTSLGYNPDYHSKELVNYRIAYRTAVDRNLYFVAESKILDGLIGNRAGFDKYAGNNRFSLYFKSMYRNNYHYWYEYLQPHAAFAAGMRNNSLNAEVDHSYHYHRGTGKILLGLRSSSLYSDYDYASAKMEVINHNNLGKIEVHTRTFGQYITGSRVAPESYLYVDGANGEEMMDSKYLRSELLGLRDYSSFDPNSNIAGYAGGLNLRGYNLMLLPVAGDAPGVFINSNRGRGGAAVNIEMDFDRLFRFRPKFLRNTFRLDCYLFGDAGIIRYETISIATIPATFGYKWSDLMADAGAGLALTIKKWGPLATVDPLTIRVDFPMWVQQIGSNRNTTNLVIGIGRTF